MGWHPRDAGGTATILEDYPTDEEVSRGLVCGENNCGERRRASPLGCPDYFTGEGPGEAFAFKAEA